MTYEDFQLRCGYCGKFVSNKQIETGDVIAHHTPDTEYSVEESFWFHRECSQTRSEASGAESDRE